MNIEYDKFIEWAKSYTDWPALEHRAKDAFSNWNTQEPGNPFDKSKEIVALLNDVIVLAEQASKDLAFLNHKDKLEIVVKFIDDAIHLPFYFEWVDQVVIRHMVTAIVEQYNRIYGHKWLEVVNANKP